MTNSDKTEYLFDDRPDVFPPDEEFTADSILELERLHKAMGKPIPRQELNRMWEKMSKSEEECIQMTNTESVEISKEAMLKTADEIKALVERLGEKNESNETGYLRAAVALEFAKTEITQALK